jgi:peptidoglycan/LPS O-acetylase OafA/YrhL
MSISTATLTTTQGDAEASTSLRRTTVVAGLVGAAAATAVAATAHGAGVPLDVEGQIPLFAFAQMTLLGAVIGGIVAAVLRRRSDDPVRRFVQVTTALVVLSCVPSVALPPDTATKLALVTTHLVAAAIIIPALARRLSD